MLGLIKEQAVSMLIYLVATPVMGWALLGCLWELADGLGIQLKRDKKLKCWIYLSLIVFLFTVLLKNVSS